MDEPRIVELPPYRVVALRYEGPPPPDARFFELWDRFNAWASARQVKSVVEGVWAFGYMPPLPGATTLIYHASTIVYDVCVPVGRDFSEPDDEGFKLCDLPGGRFILCAGDIQEFPFLYRASRRYAMNHGLPIERGGVERYLPHAEDSDLHPVEAGYRIHD